MTPPADQSGMSATEQWDRHLAQQLENKDRAYTFDMEEAPEREHLAHFPRLEEALRFLDEHVKPVYSSADSEALLHQNRHRLLSRVAILGGGLAIGFAILQLALKQSLPGWTWMAGALEAVAVLAGLAAVGFGLWAKSDDQWFIQRHRAERLRMLKFQSLGRAEFWASQMDEWRRWVSEELAGILQNSEIKKVKEWATSGQAEPFEPVPPACLQDETALATVIYYRRKRVDFQAAYFRRQSERFKKEAPWLHQAGLPLFFGSIVMVILHFIADYAGHHAHDHAAAHLWELVGVWALAMAALLPVLGFGARAWIAAFERTRSAHQFKAKHRGLVRSSDDLVRDQSNCGATMHHIAHVEHFLEHEHREWLRLLLDAEWFL